MILKFKPLFRFFSAPICINCAILWLKNTVRGVLKQGQAAVPLWSAVLVGDLLSRMLTVLVGHRGLCAAAAHWPVVVGWLKQRPCMAVHEWHVCSAAKYSSNNGCGEIPVKKTDDISLRMNKAGKAFFEQMADKWNTKKDHDLFRPFLCR